MNSYRMLYGWMKEIVNEFTEISFKYYFDYKYNTYFIAVFPESEITDEYCEKENEIFKKLSNNFPAESYVFGTEEQNFKTNDSFVEFSRNMIPAFDFALDEKLEKNLPESQRLDSIQSIYFPQISVVVKSISKSKPSSSKYEMRPMRSIHANLN